MGHLQVTLCLCIKTRLPQNLSYKNKLHLHENEIVGRTHFHFNGSTQSLVAERPIIQLQTSIQSICQITSNCFKVTIIHVGFRFHSSSKNY